MRIFILSKISNQALFYKKVYDELGIETHLITEIESIKIKLVNQDESICYLNKTKIEKDDIVHLLDLLKPNEEYFDLSKNQIYKLNEIESALLAFLFNYKIKVVNAGYSKSFAQYTFEKYSFIKKLGAIGWKTPSVTTEYSFNLSNPFSKSYYPNIELGDKYLLIIVGAEYLILPDSNHINLIDNYFFEHLIKKTIEELAKLKIDFCTIPISIFNNEIYVSGINYDLPTYLSIKSISKMIKEIL